MAGLRAAIPIWIPAFAGKGLISGRGVRSNLPNLRFVLYFFSRGLPAKERRTNK